MSKLMFYGVVLQCFFFSMLLASNGEAQKMKNINLSVDWKEVSLEKAFESIEQLTGFSFLYNPKSIKKIDAISFDSQQTSLKDLLVYLAKENKLRFKRINNTIIVDPLQKRNQQIVEEIVTRDVSGKITDEEDNPLPGVNVLVKGTTFGTVTDTEGYYKLSVPDDATTLVFTYIGYVTEEIAIGNQATIDVKLVPDIETLSEVVVTAFGIEREKKALGYAVSEVGAEEITKASSPSIATALYGKAAGVQITANSGGPTAGVNVLIRGNNSITGFNQPLFVVDGIPIEHGDSQYGRWGGSDPGNGASDINPEDVESISVLKGANAAALYGSRAANGVVLITTKKGTKKKGLGVELSSNYTVDKIAFVPDFQNEYGSGFGYLYLGGNNDGYFNLNDDGERVYRNAWASFGPKMEGQTIRWWDGELRDYSPQPDNYNDLFREGHTGSTTLTLTNASENANYRLAYTRFDHEGTFHGVEQERNVLSLTSNLKISEKLTADVALNYYDIKTTNRPPRVSGLVGYEFPRSTKTNLLFENYKDKDGYRIRSEDAPSMVRNFMNVLWGALENSDVDDKNRLIGNFTLNYQITPWLNLRGKAGTDFSNIAYETKQRTVTPDNPSGYYSLGKRETRNDYADLVLSFNKNITEDLALSLSVGGSTFTEKGSFVRSWTDGGLVAENWFSLNNSLNTRRSEGSRFEERNDAVFGFGQLAYKNMLFLDFTARNDWTSTLPPENNSYFYPSVSASFVFSDAIELPSWLSFGKVRASWAQVGNDATRYQANKLYDYGSYNGVTTNSFSSTVPPSNLLPERQRAIEFGADLRFLGNRVGIDLTYYKNNNFDQIINLGIAQSSGGNSITTNVGEMTNSGFEALIYGTPVKAGDFQWDVSFSYARNRNEVVELAEGIERLQLSGFNYPMVRDARPGQPFGVWSTFTYQRDANGNKVVDADGYYLRDDSELVPVGNSTPDWIGGLTNTVSYKGINLSFLIDIKMGGDMFSFTNYYGINAGKLEESLAFRDEAHGGLPYYVDANGDRIQLPSHDSSTPNGEIVRHNGMILEGVTEDGQPNDKLVPASEYYLNSYYWNYGFHEEGLYDNSYIKFRELSLGYTFPQSLMNKVFLQNLTLSFIGRNLFYIHKNIPNIDPESDIGTNQETGAAEYGAYPSTRSFGFSLKANF
ncbi:SusC/RagA family TonB-linked outer membrane protein [Fulvivirgaceae bacterium BMA12]|uniref:SusC/RagA family TonB-linked outer membrane protein n=1 Tax=Agaribacillus aureus TaxID=3051825 RepID=A0ABT8L0W9_9BACT|nr:SusC/RagA family TonB-linked outer membrane protein [Fulvivirgaceae bacterium BMA12]